MGRLMGSSNSNNYGEQILLCKSSITCTISATTDIILTAALSTPCRAGKPETSSYIVRNETNGSCAIEQFLARIILGNSYGVWDKLNVAKGRNCGDRQFPVRGGS